MPCFESERISRPYDISTVPPTTAIVEAIAELEDIDPIELERELGFTIYEYVHTDAFNKLVTESEDVAVSFDIQDYHVWIDGNDLFVERS